MTWQEMLETMDSAELAYQIALDRIERDEVQARRHGVPTVSETLAVSPGRRIGRGDPEWYQKIEATIR